MLLKERMIMKIKRITLITLAVLPLIVATVALFFLPDQIPAHFGANFEVDRYGSKFEILILPAEILLMSLIFLFPSIFVENEQNKKLLANIGIGLTLLLSVLNYFFLYAQASNAENINTGFFSIERVLMLLFAVFFIFVGNLMPLTRKNSFIGLRTKWSKHNNTVWKKSQLFGGLSMMVLGGILLVLAFVFPNIFLMLALLIAVVIVDTVYSYIAFKKYNNAKN